MQHLLGDNRGVPDRQSYRKICLQLPFKKVKTENDFVTFEDPLENFNGETSLGIG